MVKYINQFVLLFSLVFASSGINAQDSIRLETCYELAKENFPLTKQRGLITQSESYSIDNASKGYLPKISLHAQATYQTDVPRLPFSLPGTETPLVPKDQYKVYGELTQTIYDGGAVKLNKAQATTSSMTSKQQLEVELYTLKERINQLFFGILMIEEQQQQLTLRRKDLELGLSKVNAAVEAGIALKSNSNVLKVELLKVNQRFIEFKSTRQAYIEMLSLMIGKTLDEQTSFIKPPPVYPMLEIQRPELKLFELQTQSLSLQNDQLETGNRPKIQLFMQGGLGRPGLNIFDREVKGYWIGGLQVVWPLVGYYTTNNKRNMISLEQDQIHLKRETFLYNTNLQLARNQAEIHKLEQMLSSDDEIINLLSSIKNTSLTQMENGIITANDYLVEVNKEDLARQNKIIHAMQLLMTQYTAKTTAGN